jgi:ATP/maltotriose-dependent transcriptional regulator MalT
MQASVLLARMIEVGTEAGPQDGSARGWVGLARGFFQHLLDDKPWQALVSAEQGTSAFLEVDAEVGSLATRGLIGQAMAALGDMSGAEEQLRLCLTSARRLEQPLMLSVARTHLALVLSSSPEPGPWEEARTLALEEIANPGPRMHLGLVHSVLARVALRRGELAEAEAQAHKANELLATFPSFRLLTHIRGTVLLAQGRTAEARQEASHCVREWEALGRAGVASVGVHLLLAETCFTQGDTGAGEAALRTAVRCVRERARDIPDEAARERFLRQVPENARALELARQRWGEDMGS